MRKQKPFFAKLLESQIPGKEMADTRAGCHTDISVTLKAPSDMEDDITSTNASRQDVVEEIREIFIQTMKSPSDCEDH